MNWISLHSVSNFQKEVITLLAQTSVITLKTQTHAVNTRWKRLSQLSLTYILSSNISQIGVLVDLSTQYGRSNNDPDLLQRWMTLFACHTQRPKNNAGTSDFFKKRLKHTILNFFKKIKKALIDSFKNKKELFSFKN